MRPLNKGFLYTTCCALALGLPANIFAQEQGSRAPLDPQVIVASELPDSPGATRSKAEDASSSQQSSSSSTQSPASGQTDTRQTAPAQDQGQKPQRPVGTAAAEAPKAKGVTAAQPSGIAIAPAKQRRVRTIVIKVGAMVAAGAAVGTVIGLTKATPSRPPGAH
jgi:cytoskeletal protein RodZ